MGSTMPSNVNVITQHNCSILDQRFFYEQYDRYNLGTSIGALQFRNNLSAMIGAL